MLAESVSLEKKVEELAAQLEELRLRVDGMTVAGPLTPPARPEPAPASPAREKTPSDLVSWAGSSSLLPRVSTLCFLLVIALALRTVTDSGMIETHAGSITGMIYASSLMLVGWLRYRKESLLAPVFSLSGALLMYSVVVETHSHFGSLPTTPAYLLLIGTGMFMALTGRMSRSSTPLTVGLLGMCLAGVAINLPAASFPPLAAVLFLANLLAYQTARLLRRDWLRWVLFALTGAVIQVWGVRLKVVFADPDLSAASLGPQWFIPAVALLGLFYFGSSIFRMLNTGAEGRRVFDYVAPATAALVFFTAARYVAVPLWGGSFGLGAAGIVVASTNLGAASWMVRGKKLSALEFNSFTFAAVVLLVLSLSAATGALLAALPLLSAAAFHLALISHRWESGGTRVISYILQVFVAFTLALVLATAPNGVSVPLSALAAGTVGLVGFLHYRWCRRQAPPARSVVFSRLDGKDYCGCALLLASLTGWFFLFRIGAYQVVAGTVSADEMRNVFVGFQSLLINAAAIGLLAVSYAFRHREARNVAVLIILIGAAKVFLYDMVIVEGLPRVFSVFSFGLVAAVASYVLSRWQRKKLLPARPPADGAEGISQEG